MSATVWNAGTVGAAGIDSVAAEAAQETRKAAAKPAAAKRRMRIVQSPMDVIGARAIYAGSWPRILRPPVAPARGTGDLGQRSRGFPGRHPASRSMRGRQSM